MGKVIANNQLWIFFVPERCLPEAGTRRERRIPCWCSRRLQGTSRRRPVGPGRSWWTLASRATSCPRPPGKHGSGRLGGGTGPGSLCWSRWCWCRPGTARWWYGRSEESASQGQSSRCGLKRSVEILSPVRCVHPVTFKRLFAGDLNGWCVKWGFKSNGVLNKTHLDAK